MMVMKYALAEQKNIELSDKIRKLEATASELTTEKDNLMTYLNTMRAEKQKLKETHDKKVRLSLFAMFCNNFPWIVCKQAFDNC
jgi:hypothetical protein